MSFESGLPLFAVVQPGFEFAFAKAQDVGAEVEGLFFGGESASGRALFLGSAAATFVEGLQPEAFGEVGDGFGEPVQRRGAGV